MKLLKHGKLPEPETPWWVDVVVECPKCGAKMQLDELDATSTSVTIYAERTPGGRQWLSITCLECQHEFEVDKPAAITPKKRKRA